MHVPQNVKTKDQSDSKRTDTLHCQCHQQKEQGRIVVLF